MMAEYPQENEDYYPACFSSSSSQMAFTETQAQYGGINMVPLQQNDFQPSFLKDEIKQPAMNNQASMQSLVLKKNVKCGKQMAVAAPSAMEQPAISQRRRRTVYAQEHLNVLEEFFQRNMYPDIHHREELAAQICIAESRIQVWFQNRRGKARREKDKSTYFANASTSYSNILQPGNIYSTTSTPKYPMAEPKQPQIMVPQQQQQPMMNLRQELYDQAPEPAPYPHYSYADPREKFMMHQSLPNSYQQDLQSCNQPHVYKNMTPVMSPEAMDLSSRSYRLPTETDYMMDLNSYPPNMTITQEMNVNIPPIPLATRSYSKVNPFTKQPVYSMPTMPTMHDNHFKENSDTDSGVSDRSPDSVSKESISSVLSSLGSGEHH